jgi:hypothetical protein
MKQAINRASQRQPCQLEENRLTGLRERTRRWVCVEPNEESGNRKCKGDAIFIGFEETQRRERREGRQR